ncbi:dipeptide transport ATP-binding protein [Haemophilus influenzae 22.1-21]|nr:dipeptide transport ATP-binding protein [Haemophilus influenzae 22.1-21]
MFAKPQQVKALDGVSFQLERGKTLAVVGESGCGKSTLGRLLTMIEQPSEGELYYKGHNFLENDSETKALRRKKFRLFFKSLCIIESTQKDWFNFGRTINYQHKTFRQRTARKSFIDDGKSGIAS